MEKRKIFVLAFSFCAALMLTANFVLADDATSTQATTTIDTKLVRQQDLQKQLDAINSQIAEFQAQLDDIKGQKNTLQNKINQLKKSQSALALKIKAIALEISDLDQKIGDTQSGITLEETKAALLSQQIAAAIRQINERDSQPLLYSVVANENLSQAVDDLRNFASLSQNLSGLLDEAKLVKADLEQKKLQLTGQQEDAKNLLSVQNLQQQQLSSSVNEQNELLQETKGRESDYQITLNDTKRRAAEIQGRIYDLLGISNQITFGEAYKIAVYVSQQTGIDPAFLLAILTQESNLGKNVGTCNRPGDPPEKSWKVVMKPTRDQDPFIQITSELGLDPDTTPVSCPMKDKKGNQLGWGGAMGPAQFIPSTWMGYRDKISSITGKPANPWDIRDAFLAAGIKLTSNGADGSDSGDWAAAMRYFSGSTNLKYRFYGDNVIALKQKYQADIATLNSQGQ